MCPRHANVCTRCNYDFHITAAELDGVAVGKGTEASVCVAEAGPLDPQLGFNFFWPVGSSQPLRVRLKCWREARGW